MNKALSIFNQLRPVSIGFDDVFNHFERMFADDFYISAGNHPPYNIVKTGSQSTTLKLRLRDTVRTI